MIHSGLVSVTFRALSPAPIVELASRAGMTGIEWGGDIHAPHGDIDRAKETRKLTVEAGLKVAAYGSYYRVGRSPAEGLEFATVLDTALELGAPLIRVWPGDRDSEKADESYRRKVADESRRIADQAAAHAVDIAFEYHAGGLTNTAVSAAQLLQSIDHPHAGCLWQIRPDRDHATNRADLRTVLPWLRNVHVFHWLPDHRRLPLADGRRIWREHFSTIAAIDRDVFAMIEFVQEDDPEQFIEDAQILRGLIVEFASG